MVSLDDEIPVFGYTREYEKNFDDIFRTMRTTGDITTIKYPGWMRDAFNDIMDYYGKSSLIVVTNATIHGNDIITTRYEEELIKYSELRRSLRHNQNGEIKDMVRDFKMRIGDEGAFAKKNIRVDEGIHADITRTASDLNLEFSSYCRLCACITFLQGEHILHEKDIIIPAKKKVNSFEQSLKWHLEVLEKLNNPLVLNPKGTNR